MYGVEDTSRGMGSEETARSWDRAEDIDFGILPNQFVLKCNHDCGSIVICKDKKTFDSKGAVKKLRRRLKRDAYLALREWPYKNVPRKVIAEKYMEDPIDKELKDFKFFCFNGKMKAMFIASDRQNKDVATGMDYFDKDWNWLDFTWGEQHARVRPQKPELFDEMVGSHWPKSFLVGYQRSESICTNAMAGYTSVR